MYTIFSYYYSIPLLFKNYNLGSNLKVVSFWPNIVIWFADYNGKRIIDKKYGSGGLKAELTHKKMKTTGRYLVDLGTKENKLGTRNVISRWRI